MKKIILSFLICIFALMSFQVAEAKTSYDKYGKKTGSYKTSGSTTTKYNKYGQKEATYKKSGSTTTSYDKSGRKTGSYRTSGSTTTSYDKYGRKTGSYKTNSSGTTTSYDKYYSAGTFFDLMPGENEIYVSHDTTFSFTELYL